MALDCAAKGSRCCGPLRGVGVSTLVCAAGIAAVLLTAAVMAAFLVRDLVRNNAHIDALQGRITSALVPPVDASALERTVFAGTRVCALDRVERAPLTVLRQGASVRSLYAFASTRRCAEETAAPLASMVSAPELAGIRNDLACAAVAVLTIPVGTPVHTHACEASIPTIYPAPPTSARAGSGTP